LSFGYIGGTETVDIGNILEAQFREDEDWTVLIFFQVHNTAGDDRSLIAKFGAGSTQRPFLLRCDKQAAPSNLEVYSANTAVAINGGNVIELHTWYLAAVTNKASGTNLTLYTLNMGGNFVDDTLTGTSNSEPDYGEPIEIGSRAGGTNDPYIGWIQYTCYIKQTLTKAKVLEYLTDPIGVAWSFGWDCVFILDFGHGDTPTIKDLGPRRIQNVITMVGSPLRVAPNPPSLIEDDFMFTKAAAAAAVGPVLRNPFDLYKSALTR